MYLVRKRIAVVGPVLDGDTSMGTLQATGSPDHGNQGGWLDHIPPTEDALESRLDDMPRVSQCAKGHPVVAYVEAECPVCTLTRRTGYSEKWCDSCDTTTAHVGGGHISAVCVRCVSSHPSPMIG